MDCSAHVSALLEQVSDLPPDLVHVIRDSPNAEFLAKIASLSMEARYTDTLFTYLEPLFAELCARWTIDTKVSAAVAAFGRILPFAPYLAEYAELFLNQTNTQGLLERLFQDSDGTRNFWETSSDGVLLETLLGIFRMLVVDDKAFAKRFNLSSLEIGLTHTSRPIRYLTIRILCVYLRAADAAMEEMIEKYLGNEAIYGLWEGKNIDFRFLSLWEEKRNKDMANNLGVVKKMINGLTVRTTGSRKFHQQDLSPTTAEICGILMPRTGGSPSTTAAGHLVPTASTVRNVRAFAQGLLQPSPVLLIGLAGTGKTTIVNHCAQQLNKLESMVTLHLNEQSDVKLLIGMYTSGSTPGTFTWRPGALTTAVREGRWVFIEDLDRAPNDIVSTLVPLIERGELLIPSRGEVIKAARGFKIIATMRTYLDVRGNEILPRQHMVGSRFWRKVSVTMSSETELSKVISVIHPKLRLHIPRIISVYSNLKLLSQNISFSGTVRTSSTRPLSPRDLLKWCARMSAIFPQPAGFSESLLDSMFLEAVDCFAGYLPTGEVFHSFTSCIAQDLHIDALRRDHLLNSRELRLSLPGNDLIIGRSTNRVSKQRKIHHQRFFANSPHTLRLLERLAVAVSNKEPMLLAGETGIGKTTCVQQLADQLGRFLVSFNLSQQSESGDLLGGFKPVNVRGLIMPLKDEFDELYNHEMSPFSRRKEDNTRFADILTKACAKGQWRKVCKMWKNVIPEVEKIFQLSSPPQSPRPATGSCRPRKKQRTSAMDGTNGIDDSPFYQARWRKFAADVIDLDSQLASKSDAFAFRFVEGSIVKAVRNGDWVLLDEINLATPDTLEALVDLLGGSSSSAPSLLLTETGKLERITAHPNFRIFAAMNPATDVGKKDLPLGIRSRFTEIYVDSPDRDMKSLLSIVQSYLPGDLGGHLVRDVTNLYCDIQRLVEENKLIDGAGQKPHFSLRTLTRTLTYARDIAVPVGATDGFYRRALYEGFQMSFLTLLDGASEATLSPKILQHLFGKHANANSELKKPLPKPNDGRTYVQDGRYWIRKGAYTTDEDPEYIITPFVRQNLDNLIRAVSSRKLPILIQGPTSSGKTSMIEYLAKKSGNKFVRINNHEHTDLQEYLGTYVSGADGRLHFQEGILVEALRKGHWIVLDELNLAPSDVLEALNRLLDDNRELLIPETQDVVTPHPDFMLFATQNPAGLYGGRKHLSRAFRNRFLELHFDDIPVDELCDILYQRTKIPRSWGQRIVDTYKELSTLRQENRLFEQKSFATLRDLFRWAMRKADTTEQLAKDGFMLLAERVRKPEEREKVKGIIEDVLSRKGARVRIDEQSLYSDLNSPEIAQYRSTQPSHGVVWTKSMKRLFILVAHALRNNEPVLLVGETGCGKTTVCQMLAETFGKELFNINAHQNTETGDLIGSQRPIRNRGSIEKELRELLSPLNTSIMDVDTVQLEAILHAYDGLDDSVLQSIPNETRQTIKSQRAKWNTLFEWRDGSLVHAMKTGQLFLLDEISLADDSVLERLNSVLEPARSLLLAEKGPIDSSVKAADGFQFLATMNPGGDYGKKELSPALRNRFTEIWVPSLYDMEDVLGIVEAKLSPSAAPYANAIVNFSHWFNRTYNNSAASAISIRDTLAWIELSNHFSPFDPRLAIMHGAAMVYIDTLGANPAAMLSISPEAIDIERRKCITELGRLLDVDLTASYLYIPDLTICERQFGIGPFFLARDNTPGMDPGFTFNAPTTRSNAMRIFRALQLTKPILIEGNPGVGKTTLVTAIANTLGKQLVRINLSEQTDLMDLFGSDVPVEGAGVGSFTWRDAPFLSAMKKGDWVLLDEMNLASQSVLEGLNACLDHRSEAYVAELDQTFLRHPNFRLFAAQNPHHQGGGRKGLPASFVNRFTVVYADIFRPIDLLVICKQVFPNISDDKIETLSRFVLQLDTDVTHSHKFGAQGGPWEFNLRDTLRWLQLLTSASDLLPSGRPYDFCDTIFRQRFRNNADRTAVDAVYTAVFNSPPEQRSFYHNLAADAYQVGLGLLGRKSLTSNVAASQNKPLISQLPTVESLMICIQQNWPSILVGPAGCGKTTLLQHLAAVSGAKLVSFPMNADIDAMDLVGGYEQADTSRPMYQVLFQVMLFAQEQLLSTLLSNVAHEDASTLFRLVLHTMDQTNPSKVDLEALYQTLSRLDDEIETNDSFELLQILEQLLDQPEQSEKARFEWVDGILIQSLERGDWLVLDNANLCSSSVLDRLNSLLEPDGYLSINEHPLENGDARIIKPHPKFRIFLTMDPRNGELSRAMRNRAIELFILSTHEPDIIDSQSGVSFSLESATYRYRNFADLETVDSQNPIAQDYISILADHISFQDCLLTGPFLEQIVQGLLDSGADRRRVIDDLELVADISTSWATEAQGLPLLLLSKLDGGKVQSIHPLNNDLLTRYNAQSALNARWLSEAYDTLLDISRMENAFNNAKARALERKPCTHFDRSIHLSENLKFGTESTIRIAPFLKESWRGLKDCVAYLLKREERNVGVFSALKVTRFFWWQFFHLVDSANMEEAIFQIYLNLGRVELVQAQNTSLANHFIAGQLGLLEAVTTLSGLTTGKSMEVVWKTFRPPTVSTMDHLASLLRLENLADRFDTMIFPVRISLHDLCQIRETFGKAIRTATLDDFNVEDLIEELEAGISSMESSKPTDVVGISTPFFKTHFEAICQYFGLAVPSGSHSNATIPALIAQISLLAQRPTKRNAFAAWHSIDQGDGQRLLLSVDAYAGEKMDVGSPKAIQQNLQLSLVGRLAATHTITLGELDQFRSELEVLAQVMAVGAETLCENQQNRLDQVLNSLMTDLIRGYDEVKDSSSEDRLLQQLAQDTTSPVAKYLQNSESSQQRSLQAASRAWIYFALSCIFAYVPNRPFDPALKHSTQRKLLAEKKTKLQTKLQALELFELSFSGQPRNLRYSVIEEELKDLSDDIPDLQIPRPIPSELNGLQGEFNIVLQIARNVESEYMQNQHVSDASVRQNISQMIIRLRDRYRAYDDIVVPLIGFLQCLNVGLMFEELSALQDENKIAKTLPLAQLQELQQTIRPVFRSAENIEESLYHLSQYAIIRNITLDWSHFRFVNQTHQIFEELFSAWKDNISTEQEKFAKNSSLYTFRGGQEAEEEDNEEEYNNLFPNFDEDSSSNTNVNGFKASRDAAIRISTMHSEIFGGGSDPQTLLRNLLNQAGAMMKNDNTSSTESATAALPYIYFTIQQKIWTLDSGIAANQNYNMYTDPNVAEAKKLVSLVGRIQRHFRGLLSLEFEHATVDDVIRIGNEILAFQHTEPVAKFMTKSEKLHEAMNEWERVASKSLSAITLYTELTDLIVSWRRLELTTWTKLYDLEMTKCVDDAKSWWFIAYENIVAVPQSLALAGERLDLHAEELLKTLELFFVSTTMGQYQERLQFVTRFQRHLQLLLVKTPELKVIYTSLTNFVSYYARFQQPVSDTLMKGRQKLEKDMKEIVLLASWKDTNIASLKQSAQASHRKLFKLVRKFRELLNQPVNSIIEQGPPDEVPTGVSSKDDSSISVMLVHSSPEAYKICELGLNNWDEISPRFKNTSVTISKMRKNAEGLMKSWDGTGHIEDFLTDLESSMSELQKITPTILNDETKDTIKHLKTRKRALFAHVLKELRRMGFQYNLSTDVLLKQDSASAILASLPALDSHDQFPIVKDAEYHFHKTLSLIQHVRKIQREHSGDLTPAEVARSTGFLESILQRILQQRQRLATAVTDFDQFDVVLQKVTNLWGSQHQFSIPDTNGHNESQFTAVRSAVTWLVPISKLFIDLLSTQSQLGKFDASIVIAALRIWAQRFAEILDQFNNLPDLPEGIHSSLHADITNRSLESLTSFRDEASSWTKEFSMLTPLLGQLTPWTFPVTTQTSGKVDDSAPDLSDVKKAIFTSTDSALGSIQELGDELSRFPTSFETPAWLTEENRSHEKALAALHTKYMIASLLASSDALKNLPEENLRIAAALFSVILPILQQYQNISRAHLAKYAKFHNSLCKLSHRLCTSFVQIGTKGFCTPPDKTTGGEGQDEKLEGGTGLGEGEGAEDISKDIGDDEDLTELAQEPDTKTDRDDMEDEKDAVDMADAEMEGEIGEAPEKVEDEEGNGSGDDEDADDEMEEEAGPVDDLGPETVDEKMWDGGDKADTDKEKEDDQGKGSNQDEQVAAQDGTKEEGREDEPAEQDGGAEENEAVGQDKNEKTDQHLERGDTLDLPDDMDMDGNATDKSDDNSLGDLSDLDGGDAESMQLDEDVGDETGDDQTLPEDQDGAMDDLADDLEKDADEAAETDEVDKSNDNEEEILEEQDKVDLLNAQDEKANAADDAVPSNTQGIGLDPNQQEDDPSTSKSAAQQESGANGEEKDNNQGTEGEQGANGHSDNQEAVGRSDGLQDSAESQPFKKLGDTFEKWYNQQRQIRQPTEKNDAPQRERKQDIDMADVDFEHLLNEESRHEAQALGAASEDQARALNDENAMPTNDSEIPQNSFADDENNDAAHEEDDVKTENAEPNPDRKSQDKQGGQANTFIGDPKSQDQREHHTEEGAEADSEQDLEDVDTQLSSIHLDPSLQQAGIPHANARGLWALHEQSTRNLSATLTEQLRLILAPTMATKLRGDFRTGKRLNIKRIIPYIASSYKRDKIWMRRSVPSKRAYQIMIALDDSKSMAEGGSKDLAFETLALVAKALSMLESGELCVVGFGEDVKIAHPFDRPFTDDAGVEVFSKFTFEQEKTDVRRLVSESIGLFQEARAKASNSTSELWQLMLVVSDAICNDAEEIRRLVRKSQEEKIMIVFVVVDAGARETEGRKGQSIMDLETVEFKSEANGDLKVHRYKYMTDLFPFRWWIVVRDVKELPGVLASALRQWFAEVVEMA